MRYLSAEPLPLRNLEPDNPATRQPDNPCRSTSSNRLAYHSSLIIRVFPKVLGFTLARSRNSATPSSCDISIS